MPRNVSISDEVWDYIAERGHFGETVDDVLRRIFGMSDESKRVVRPERRGEKAGSRAGGRRRQATERLSAEVDRGRLRVAIKGQDRSWDLPGQHEGTRIAAISAEAQAWADAQGATYGQCKAVHKALTEAGYYITGPRRRT